MNTVVPVRSVKKALDLLSLLAFDDLERAGIPLTVLAARMQMPVNTAHNLLKTMVACGYVARTASGEYTVGSRCNEMGRLNTVLSAAAARVVQERMEALGGALGESVTFAVLADGQRKLLLKADAGHAIRVDSSALEQADLFAVPTGRVLAAFATPDALDRILERAGLPGAAWHGIQSRAALDRALDTIRKQGFEKIAPDIHALVSFAVPVLSRSNDLLGALGCYAPAFRCGPAKHAPVLAQLRETAAAIAAAL
jgi:IclR family acetate operon transcriptional repressor